MSVSSTGFAISKQILAIIMDAVCDMFFDQGTGRCLLAQVPGEESSPEEARLLSHSLSAGARLVVRDLVLLVGGQACEWLRGVTLTQAQSLDLIEDLLTGWGRLFLHIEPFFALIREQLCPAMRPLLKALQEEFVSNVPRVGLGAAASLTSRVVRLTRCLLLNFLQPTGSIEELELVVTLLLHALHPDRNSSILAPEDIPGGYFSQPATSGSSSLIGRLNMAGLAKAVKPASANRQGTALTASNILVMAFMGSGPAPSSPTQSASKHRAAHTPSSVSYVPAHPAGACLETLLAFFLGCVPEALAYGEDAGCRALAGSMSACLLSVSNLLTSSLAIEQNCKDLDAAARESMLIQLIESALTGSEPDSDAVVRTLHEHLAVSASIEATDVIVLALLLMQVLSRLLIKLSVCSLPLPVLEFAASAPRPALLFPPDLALSLPRNLLAHDDASKASVLRTMAIVCENSFDFVNTACSMLLLKSDCADILKRSLGVLAEFALSAGFAGLSRPSSHALSALCRFTVPGADPLEDGSAPCRWRHMQAQVRVVQIVSVLADVLLDWNSVAQALDQLQRFFASGRGNISEEVTPAEIAKLFAALQRFKRYSRCLSGDALLRLVDAVVGLSRSYLASHPTAGSPTHCSPSGSALSALERVSFSLQAAVEILKHNVHRAAAVWSPVVEHLQELATHRGGERRVAAVEALFDVINTVLQFQQAATRPLSEPLPPARPAASRCGAVLSDDVVFNRILPPFETVFTGRTVGRSADSAAIPVSQPALFSALWPMCRGQYDDVRLEVVTALFALLQEKGHMLDAAGWAALVDLVSAVPLSAAAAEESEAARWPRAALTTAFNCTKFIVDEFCGSLPVPVVTALIACLAGFAAQLADVNMSLTSVEMLWKVCDLTLSRFGQAAETGVAKAALLEELMARLLHLAMDSRPEVRNCALNTLFAATTANASLISGGQWREQVFQRVIFPLFEQTQEKSSTAVRCNEQATVPELKKGVRMAMHHSRDTAQKQWAETRTLVLRGLSRVVRTVTRLLLREEWFSAAWTKSLALCTVELYSADELEVALASVEVLFGMLKTARSGGTMAVGTSAEDWAELEQRRESLWKRSWRALAEAGPYACSSPELALHLVQSLAGLLQDGDAVFQHSENMQVLLSTVAVLARPRLVADEGGAGGGRAHEVQLQRSIITLLRTTASADRLADPAFVCSLIGALAQISFASAPAYLCGADSSQLSPALPMAPAPPRLRAEAGALLLELLRAGSSSGREAAAALLDTPRLVAPAVLEVVVRRFLHDCCSPLLAARCSLLAIQMESLPAWTAAADLSQHRLQPLRPSLPPAAAVSWQGSVHMLLSTELDVLLAALNFENEPSDDNPAAQLSESWWSAAVLAISCALCPWTAAEGGTSLAPKDKSPSPPEALSQTQLRLDALLACAFGPALRRRAASEQLLCALVAAVAASTRLVLQSCLCGGDCAADGQRLASWSVPCKLMLVDKVRGRLLEVLQHDTHSAVFKNSALAALLDLTCDLGNAFLLLPDEAAPLADDLAQQCNQHLLSLLQLSVGLEQLPLDFNCGACADSLQLLRLWCMASAPSPPRPPVPPMQAEVSGWRKAHLLLLLPLAVRLSGSDKRSASAAALRATAQLLVEQLDLVWVAASFRSLAVRAAATEAGQAPPRR